jgi:3-phosphoshikimate 1-carboxyvinyltransferase
VSPVSFERVGDADDRDALLAQARLLAEAGVRIQAVDEERGLLVRSDLAARARAVLAGAGVGDSDAGAGSTGPGPGPRPIVPLEHPVDADIELPGSKSHTNRALLCAGLAPGRSRLARVLFADDTEAMMGALTALGVTLATDPDGAVEVDGGLAPDLVTTTAGAPLVVDVNQSGTTSRFLLPVLAASPGHYVLDGHAQLRARPFGPQLAALRRLGARVDGERLPLTVTGRRLAGGPVEVAADVSSQFLSGLLLAAPLFDGPSTVTVDGPMVSRPYVELTTAVMADFGVEVGAGTDGAGRATFTVASGGYRAARVELEPDASSASYFFAAAAITGGRVRVDGLGAATVQGDLRFVELLERMGAEVEIGPTWTEVRGTGRLVGIEADMADLSDTAQTMAVVASFADGPTTLSGIGFIRHKETDRLADTVAELRRRGIEATEGDDGMVIRPGPARPGPVRTHDDHRMAMSFALLGLVHPGIEIEDPGCVAKTFPDFFDRLEGLRRR